MNRILYQNIMAHMPYEITGWHILMSGWVPKSRAGSSAIWIWEFLQGQGWVATCHWVESQAHYSLSTELNINEHFPVVWCLSSSWVAVTAIPMTSQGSKASSDGMPMMTGGRPLSIGSSFHRVCAIPANPGRGHIGLWSDVDWHGMNSWGGLVGASAFVVACMAVTGDWVSLQATNRDPLWLRAWLLQLWLQLGWGSYGMGSISQGKLTSIQ